MKKKLLHFVAICLALVMTATALPNATTKFAYATESGERDISTQANVDDGEEFYYDGTELEEDLRFVEYLQDFFTEVKIEYNEGTDNNDVFMKFWGESDKIEDETFFAKFDERTMIFEYGVDEESIEIFSEAVVSEDGSLDTVIESDYGEYNLADYKDDTAFGDLLEACNSECQTLNDGVAPSSLNGFFRSLGAVLFVVVVYEIVAQCAEQIKARSNYRHNSSLVGPTGYVNDQNDYGNFRYGFASFDQVGCGVVATYNLMLAIDKYQQLAQVIYDFERWGVEYAFAWGRFGSNSRDIWRYLAKYHVRYTKCNTLSRLDSYGSSNEYFIMGRWNDPFTRGAHIFYIYKEDGLFKIYNNNGFSADTIRDVCEGCTYMCGYAIYNN